MMMRDGIARSTSTGSICDEMDVVSIVKSDHGMDALESDQEAWIKRHGSNRYMNIQEMEYMTRAKKTKRYGSNRYTNIGEAKNQTRARKMKSSHRLLVTMIYHAIRR
jgi:hypothetical protein